MKAKICKEMKITTQFDGVSVKTFVNLSWQLQMGAFKLVTTCHNLKLMSKVAPQFLHEKPFTTPLATKS
jgi:hypothetical protein